MLPYLSANCRKNPKVLGVGNAFAGGVFVAIAFVHILPEQIELYQTYMLEQDPSRTTEYLFPLPEFCLFLGYTLILTIDKVLFDAGGILGKSDAKDVTAQPGESEEHFRERKNSLQ